MAGRLQHKVALITCATSGIGQPLAANLSNEPGARVVDGGRIAMFNEKSS